MEISDTLPAEYEERMLSASIDCDNGGGNGDACHAVGEFFALIRNDHAKAREVYSRNCDDRNHGASCFNLGRLLLAGKGGEVDEPTAISRFLKGCEYKHGGGCHHYGLLALHEGKTRTGVKYLTKACDDFKDSSSCYLVASKLLQPAPTGEERKKIRMFQGISRDALKAKRFLDAGCEMGHAPSCHNLAVMYKRGDDGIPKDEALFAKYSGMTNELVKAAGATRGVKAA